MQRCRVLIVDDDVEVREALHDELCGNYDVETAAGGGEALHRLQKERFDACISDLRMPDLSGIQVLDAAHRADPEMVRILLTGYVDDTAHRAMMRDNAPFKVGKPWHDEIEVTLRRALEHRAQRRALSSSFGEALEMSSIDDELARQEGLLGIARVVVDHLERVRGVSSADVELEVAGAHQVLAAFRDPAALAQADDFAIDELLVDDGSARAHVRGNGPAQADLARTILQRARRWASEDPITRLARSASVDEEARGRLMALARRASMGVMAASLYHELASVLHILLYSVEELAPYVEVAKPPQYVHDALADSLAAARRGMALFSAMRLFVNDGKAPHRPLAISELLRQAVTLAAPQRNGRSRITITSDGDCLDRQLVCSAPLIVQVLVNLLRNAVEASPPEAPVEVRASLDPTERTIEIAITDDGPGVPPELRSRLFQPFFTTKGAQAGTGLGLAFAHKVMSDHGGELRYEARPGRGATFVLRLPLGL